MSLILNHNISALNTQRHLSINNRGMSKSLQKLSSGYKINVAADDPSGLIISEQLRSQANGLQRAIQNSNEAMNVLSITEGSLIEMNEILRKMRSLALHAANNGVTAPDQVRADQSEVDSGIQTLDRIANTTRYSDQFLLNGSKGLVYGHRVVQDDTMDHPLLDVNLTRLDQVFKREDTSLTINFSGIKDADQADYSEQARRAYLEADGNRAGVDINGTTLSAEQSFIITGSKGARHFRFASDTELGTICDSINNLADSTGVECTLIFDSSVTASATTTAMVAGQYSDGNIQIYNAGMSSGATPLIAGGVGNSTDFTAGINSDGHGRIYCKVDPTGSMGTTADLEFYKDAEMTMLIGTGGHNTFTPANGSGLVGGTTSPPASIRLALNNQTGTTGTVADPEVYTISMVGLRFEDNAGIDDSQMNLTNLSTSSSIVSGVRLGDNTDEAGKLYFRTSGVASDKTIEVFRSADMKPEELVALSENVDLSNTAGTQAVFLDSQTMADGSDSGLNLTLNFAGSIGDAAESGQLSFTDLGMRMYSTDYGSGEYLRVQNITGELWGRYKTPELIGADDYELIEEGATLQVHGGDAQIAVNGAPVRTDGLVANLTTQDYSGALHFQEGELGLTRIAQVGYDVGGLFSRASAIQAYEEPLNNPSTGAKYAINQIYTFATNARHATAEIMEDFVGGMQFQLGEGEGDQERTVYSIPSMAAANVGRIVLDNITYSLSDVLAGGDASLLVDPVKALRIVTQAVDDISELRARLGAFQKNMLQTNVNSLEVAVENIVKTESALRDTNMAAESTEFTKNQILMQAGTAMLAQANTQQQNILSLLGG